MNNNWTLKKDGWHKKQNSETRGSAGYFGRTLPPMRDGGGRPCRADGGIDIKRRDDEVSECGGIDGWLDRVKHILGL